MPGQRQVSAVASYQVLACAMHPEKNQEDRERTGRCVTHQYPVPVAVDLDAIPAAAVETLEGRRLGTPFGRNCL